MFYMLKEFEGSGVIEIHRCRPAHEIGFDGLIGPLPEFMAGQVRAWRHELEAEMLGGDFAERARIGFTLRGGEPVLIMQSVPESHIGASVASGTLIFRTGPMARHEDFRSRLDYHTDAADWARRIIGVENVSTRFLALWVGTAVSRAGVYRGGEFDDFLTELRRREAAGVVPAQEALIEIGLEPNGPLLGEDALPLLEPDAPGAVPR